MNSYQRYKQWEKQRKLGQVPPAEPAKHSSLEQQASLDSVRDGSAC